MRGGETALAQAPLLSPVLQQLEHRGIKRVVDVDLWASRGTLPELVVMGACLVQAELHESRVDVEEVACGSITVRDLDVFVHSLQPDHSVLEFYNGSQNLVLERPAPALHDSLRCAHMISPRVSPRLQAVLDGLTFLVGISNLT